ncbi:MAG: metallophosphoesterase [Verrucomicrobia bacterium]|nr:metallophosphoesterase [Verrucomicrobiota bacterium]
MTSRSQSNDRSSRRPGLTRRRFLRGLLYGTPALALADSLCLEPNWLAVRKLNLAGGPPQHRFVFFTDLHHKGDRKHLDALVQTINALSPEFVCFGGDLIEDAEHLPDALDGLQQIRAPLYGVPGNHDYWSHADFNIIREAFAATGGCWLLDAVAEAADGKVQIAGATCMKPPQFTLREDVRRIALLHYPLWIEKLGSHTFDVALAGHSHGGQVRLPLIGPLITPFGVGRYDLGRFATASGPLYVGAGVGWFYLNVRFLCRPEITVIEI